MPAMDVPRITSTHMGTGRFRSTPASDPTSRAIGQAKANGLQLQADALAKRFIAIDGGPRDTDDRPGHVKYAAQASDNLYKGWRFVGGDNEEIWNRASNQEAVKFSYDPATGAPKKFEGSRLYESKEYYVNWDGREPALQQERGTSSLDIQWNDAGDVISLNAINLRTDVKNGDEHAEAVEMSRTPEGTTYSER